MTDYEKRYKEALQKAQKMRDENCDGCKMCMETLFPELAESEDERMKEGILRILYSLGAADNKEYIDWLEKQGEQKHGNTDSYQRAVDKACEWLRRTQPQVLLPDTTIERFRKAMED